MLSLLLLLSLLLPKAAHAQTAEDRETARRMFEEGKARRDAGDVKGALRSFEAAEALVHAPTTKLALARAHLALGHLVEARDAAVSITQIPVAARESQPFTDARASATKLATELDERIPSLTITLRGARPEALSIDGVPIPQAAWGVPRRINPGAHVASARSGGEEVRAEVSLAERENKSLVLDVPEPKRRAVTESPAPPVSSVSSVSLVSPVSPPPPAPKPEEKKPLGPVFWTAAGLGVVGLAAGAVAGAISLSEKSRADETCREGLCPPTAHEALDASRSWATISTIGFAAGGVGIGVAALSFALRPTRTSNVAVFIAPDRTGLVGGF